MSTSRFLLLTASAAMSVGPAYATDFNITSPSTAAQTLGTGSGQTGTIQSTGSLAVSGSTVAVTISGNNATLTNLGTINQTGTGRAVRDNTGVTGMTINNGSTTNSTALLQAADADVIQMNKPASVTLNNYGTMTSLNASKGGAQAVDFNAITSGSNIVNNFATGILQARDADAVRPGVNGVVNNYGRIIATNTTDTGDDGIDVQTNTGITINNFAGGSITAARHGITGGPADGTTNFTTTINNSLGGSISGNDGSGINLDGFNARQTASIVNGGTITGNGVTGDGDGIDVDGLINLTNTGTIKSLNSFSSTTPAQSEGITVGGGTIINSGTIEGDVAAGNSNAVGRGITLAGVDTSGTAEPIYGNSVITNQSGGLIKGQSDSAVAVAGGASGFTVTINNNSGATLMGGGTAFAAVRTGADNDTVNNAGTINGASSGKAIDMGAGNNTLHVTGGAASIIGDISGGVGGTNSMTISPGAGNHFAYSGAIANFNTVEVQSGAVTLSGANTYTGKTVVTGGTLVLDGANRLSANSALQLNGGTLEIANAGGPNGQTFGSFSLTENSTLDLDQSAVTFNALSAVSGGKSLTVVDWASETSPTYAFRFLGDDTTNAAFLALIDGTTINGFEAIFRFDGTYTDVSAVPLPETLTMLVSGLGLLGVLGYRRRRAGLQFPIGFLSAR
jgi:autotransporter-associated beta strand protein